MTNNPVRGLKPATRLIRDGWGRFRALVRSRVRMEPGDRAVLGPLAHRLGGRTDPKFAVLSTTEEHPLLHAVRKAWPGARLTVVDPAAGDSQRHIVLAAAGPFEAVFDLEAGHQRPTRIRQVFFHLVRGGELIVVDAATALAPPTDRQMLADRGRAEEASAAVWAGLAPAAEERPDDIRWRRAVASIQVRQSHLVLTASRGTSAKIREEELDSFLAARGETFGRVLARRPGSTVSNPAAIRTSESTSARRQKTRFEAPALSLREYVRPTCWIGQVVTKENVLLPDTYRHIARARLGNRFTNEMAPRFARVKQKGEVQDLPGRWFHLDSEFRGHFGHAMTEQLSRLWAWADAKDRFPDLKALILVNRFRTTVEDWEYRLYQAAGIARDDLILFEHPVRPERLLGATPMFSQPQYVHAGIREIYRRVGDDLAADGPDRDYPQRIFCSRRHTKRSATNTAQVEDFFAARGFHIVYPEDYPLPEQVQMFRSAADLAGFGGSAMFTMAFVPTPKRVFLVSAETYTAQNEAMIAAIQGHQLNVAWCRPQLVEPNGRPVRAKLQAQFTFDQHREGAFLREILDTH